MGEAITAIDFEEEFYNQDISLELAPNQDALIVWQPAVINVFLSPNPDAAYDIGSSVGKTSSYGKKLLLQMSDKASFYCGNRKGALKYFPMEGEVSWTWTGRPDDVIPSFDGKKITMNKDCTGFLTVLYKTLYDKWVLYGVGPTGSGKGKTGTEAIVSAGLKNYDKCTSLTVSFGLKQIPEEEEDEDEEKEDDDEGSAGYWIGKDGQPGADGKDGGVYIPGTDVPSVCESIVTETEENGAPGSEAVIAVYSSVKPSSDCMCTTGQNVIVTGPEKISITGESVTFQNGVATLEYPLAVSPDIDVTFDQGMIPGAVLIGKHGRAGITCVYFMSNPKYLTVSGTVSYNTEKYILTTSIPADYPSETAVVSIRFEECEAKEETLTFSEPVDKAPKTVLFHLKLQLEESVVPGTNVYIQYGQSGDWYHLGVTDENGNVKVPLIPPGKHNIRFADNTSLHKNSDADDITENDDFVLT